jgi:hypothetical protein
MGNLVEAIENHDPYPDGEDIELFRHVTGKEITKIGGNSLVGYTKFKPIDLIMTFGLPTESDSYKYSGSYIFQHRSGDYLQIYDWKHSTLYADDGMRPIDFWKQDIEVEFNIAAKNGWHYLDLTEWIKREIANNALTINTEGYTSGYEYDE